VRTARRPKRRPPISRRKAERALFFWTAQQSLALTRNLLAVILLAALTAFAVASMVHGELVVPPTFLR